MKKTIIVIGCLISSISFGQNLSLNELVNLQKKNIGEVEEFLTSKGWEFIKAVEPKLQNKSDEKGSNYVTISDANLLFAFDKDKNSNRANAFITYFFIKNNDNQNRIEIQLSNKEKYVDLMNNIHENNTTLKDSYVKNENIIKVYQNTTTTFKVTTPALKEGKNSDSNLYSIFLMNNELYSKE